MKHQYKPLALLSLMFLMVGSLFCMNDILLPSLITHFKLNYTQATFIQVSFYLTYIVFSIPIAWMIHKYGYKVSLLVAVLACAIGCAFFLPAKFNNADPFPVNAPISSIARLKIVGNMMERNNPNQLADYRRHHFFFSSAFHEAWRR